MNGLTCPHCGQIDQVGKVSALVSTGTQTVHSSALVDGKTAINYDRPFYTITLSYVTEGGSQLSTVYAAQSRKDAFLTAAYVIGWLEARACTVTDVAVQAHPEGTNVPVPTLLDGLIG